MRRKGKRMGKGRGGRRKRGRVRRKERKGKR
jgi:hypothetical protein